MNDKESPCSHPHVDGQAKSATKDPNDSNTVKNPNFINRIDINILSKIYQNQSSSLTVLLFQLNRIIVSCIQIPINFSYLLFAYSRFGGRSKRTEVVQADWGWGWGRIANEEMRVVGKVILQQQSLQQQMHKQNQVRRKKNKEGAVATLTSDVSHILRAINSNALWKNSSTKLNKTISSKPLNATVKPKKGLMTEEDIDRLFNKSRSKNKTQIQPIEERVPRPIKDFANSVKFLKVDDSSDKFLNGMPVFEDDFNEDQIDALFNQSSVDLTAEFKKDYTVGKVVGEGAYASVRVAMFKPLNKKVAIKIYEKFKLREPQRKKSVRREIRILQMLDHPNVVKILDVVETNNHLNIIMEYLDGISLNTYLQTQQNHRASEKSAKTIVRSLAAALEYLHSRQISHRDVKLENIILSEDLSPKLIDFGFSTCIEKNKKVKMFCGTPSYMAPEIVQKKEYRGEPADVWALGVLTFVTLTGIFPFRGATDQELYRKINNAEYPRHELYFSKEISDLVNRMLRINPDDRITAEEILAHPWLKQQQGRREKKTTEVSECRKRTTISSHRSKEKEQMNATNNVRKLTETCYENLKLELRAARQSPLKLNNTYTQRRLAKELPGKQKQNKKKEVKQVKEVKGNAKVLELLKMGLKRGEDKSKSKSRRF